MKTSTIILIGIVAFVFWRIYRTPHSTTVDDTRITIPSGGIKPRTITPSGNY